MADAKTFELVTACLAGDTDRVGAAMAAGPDIDAAIEYSHHCEVVQFLADGLFPFRDQLPSGYLDALRTYTQAVAEKNRELQDAAAEIAIEFASQRCRVLFAKGIVLSALLYPGDTRRLSKDLDIYVCDSDVDTAFEILVKLGYTEEEYPLDETRGNMHHHAMYDPERDIMLELHWDIAPVWDNITVDVDALVAASVPVDVGGTLFQALAPDDRLLFLCLELEKDTWMSLKRLADFAALICMHDEYDLDRWLAAIRDANKVRVLAISLHVAMELGMINPPPALMSVANADPVAARVGHLLVERLQSGEKTLSAWKRAKRAALLTRKHDTITSQLVHFWRVDVLWRLSRLMRYRSRRAREN